MRPGGDGRRDATAEDRSRPVAAPFIGKAYAPARPRGRRGPLPSTACRVLPAEAQVVKEFHRGLDVGVGPIQACTRSKCRPLADRPRAERGPEIVEAQTDAGRRGRRRVAATPRADPPREATELYAILGHIGHVPNQPERIQRKTPHARGFRDGPCWNQPHLA